MQNPLPAYISRPRRFFYPNQNRLIRGYWTISNAPFFPILRADELSQSNCAKKFNFMYLCGADITNIPEYRQYYNDQQGRPFFFGYMGSERAFKTIVIKILSGITHNQNYNQLAYINPRNNHQWIQTLRDEVELQFGGLNSQLLLEDLLTFFIRLYDNNGLQRFLDHPEKILFKARVFCNRVFLNPNNHNQIFTINTNIERHGQTHNVDMRWIGEFPLLDNVDIIDLESREIFELFYFREDFLQPKPSWTIGTLLEDTPQRHDYILYHNLSHKLWLDRLLLCNLDPSQQLNFEIDIAFQSVYRPFLPNFLTNQINNSDWLTYFSSFNLRLETIDQTFLITQDYSNDTVRALIYSHLAFNQRFWDNVFIENPCTNSPRDMYCNFYNHCGRKFNNQVVPVNFRREVFDWQCALKDHITMEDELQYTIGEFLPQTPSFFLNKNQLWVGQITSVNNNLVEFDLHQNVVNLIPPNRSYLFLQWTPFFYYPLSAYCRSTNRARHYSFEINIQSDEWRNWFNLSVGRNILILDFDEELKRNDLIKQRSLYYLSTYSPRLGRTRGQIQPPTPQEIRGARLTQRGTRASEATYGGGVTFI
ncbi:hypothetical protein LCGC14_0854580 [marine sediment metagenome]|uniref:Uncharacterized protein n=1 Tax=marine sediment metagenome TaxID=412755 RepID=A0A0F9SGB8_9ZZZZ